MSFLPRLFMLLGLLLILIGCNQTQAPHAAAPTISEPAVSSNAPTPPSNGMATSPPMPAEQKTAAGAVSALASGASTDEKSAEVDDEDDLKRQLIESRTRAAESRARLKAMEDRWLVLTDEECERLVAIKRILVENSGITLTPADFLFVYGTENEIFVERELAAAAAISCGPFIDFLGERLEWPTERRIVALHVFASSCRSELAHDQRAQEWCLRRAQALHKQLERDGKNTDGMPEDLLRLGVLADVLYQRNRAISEEETVYLRETAPVALRKFLRLGLDPEKVNAREEAKRVADERAALEDREKLSAAKNAAIKQIPRLVRQLESLYEKHDRLRRADRETPAGDRAREETRQGILEAEASLSEMLIDVLSASDDPGVALGEETSRLRLTPTKALRQLTEGHKEAILEAFPDNPDVRRFVKRLQGTDRNRGGQ